MTDVALAIDLCCGLGGWTDGLLAEGYDVIGYDIEAHEYGEHRYPGRLVIQDVRTIDGSQFKNAALIVASPPCQEYSYMAMPWKLAKAKAAAIRADKSGELRRKLTELFDACFRIQREACEAAGHHIPMVVEDWSGYGQPGYKAKGFNVTAAQRYRHDQEGIKSGGDWFNASQPSISRLTSSKSDSRKAASAMIAKIPLPLSRHIARVYHPGIVKQEVA